MSEQHEEYIYHPPVMVGGATGDYFVDAPVPAARWAEYAVDVIANGDQGTSSVTISGSFTPIAAVYDGSKSYTDGSVSPAIYIRIPATSTYFANMSYTRITNNSQKRVYVRIDTAASNSCYVTLRFRTKEITTVPGLIATTHPDQTELQDHARAAMTEQRLKEQMYNSEGLMVRVKNAGK